MLNRWPAAISMKLVFPVALLLRELHFDSCVRLRDFYIYIRQTFRNAYKTANLCIHLECENRLGRRPDRWFDISFW